jgi:predicted Zn-dependent protease
MSAPKRLQDGIPAGAVLSREDAQAIAERVMRFSTADGIDIQLGSNHTTNVRFADNQMSTAGAITDGNLAVQSWFGPKHAVVTTNDFSEASLKRCVEQSEVLARLAPDDPEAMPLMEPQQYAPVEAYFESTAATDAAQRARAALTALEPSRRAGDLKAAGYLVVGAGANILANSNGMFAYHRSTNTNYTLTVRTADGTGSGWAAADHPDWQQVDFARISARAIEKARASREPRAIEPGRYTVILEPQAAGDLVQLIAGYADARLADEGRSPFSKQGGGNKLGEQIVDERVTLFSDPADAQLRGQPFDGEGMRLARQVWVENGKLNTLQTSRFWAKKQNIVATGGATSLKMQGGTSSIDEMIRSTERGILVTRLWYLREVDPRTILYTGLTRDGTFLIEQGRISRSIRNLRFNESPLFLLNNLEMLGVSERIAGTEAGGSVVMPALKVRDFNFTSLSEAV